MSEDKIPVSEMVFSFENEAGAEELWAKPEPDSKYYLDYDFSYVSAHQN